MVKRGDKVKSKFSKSVFTVSEVEDNSPYAPPRIRLSNKDWRLPLVWYKLSNFDILDNDATHQTRGASTMKSDLSNPVYSPVSWTTRSFPQLLVHVPTGKVILAFSTNLGICVHPKVLENWNLSEPTNYISYHGIVSISNG